MRHQPTQGAILALVLDAHPKSLTIPDLARQMDADDPVEVAIRDLVAVGLLECGGISVRPSAAAVHFDALELP
ncbi:MAG TPA: hypothetical protein VF259_05370 [Solirubrobacterales bacterium]